MAAMLLVSGIANAQDIKPETFNFPKMTTVQKNAWTVGQQLDGVNIRRGRANMVMAFEKGDGKAAPEYTVVTDRKGADVSIVRLVPGNTLSIVSKKNNITKVQFFFTARSKSANGKNYEMTEGDYPGEKANTYVWTGKTQNFQLKNLNNKGGMEIQRILVTYEPAE